MNFKTMLLTTAAVTMMGCAANAKDFTGSLFLPSKGEVFSETNIDLDRTKYKRGMVDKDFSASEELTYGVTDSFSVYGGILNYFNFDRVTNRTYNNEHNFAYELGAKYNYNFDNFLIQFGAEYYTYKPATWWGHRGTDNEWVKIVSVEGQIGYDLGNGLVPYAKVDASSFVDTSDRQMDYAAFVGVHKTCDKIALDGGIRYELNTDEGHNSHDWYAQGEANYFVTDRVAVGVHGDYFIDGSSDNIDYDFTLGAQLKVLF